MNTEYNNKMREIMKKDYYENKGREKSLLKYYKKKYAGDPVALGIATDKTMPVEDRLDEMKKYHLEKQLDKLKNKNI